MTRLTDHSNEDPQETMRPGHQEMPRRISEARDDHDAGAHRGRRLKLGTPTRSVSAQVSQSEVGEINSTAHRGFKLGGSEVQPTVRTADRKPGVQPWILIVAGGALLLLLLAVLLTSSPAGSGEAAANQRLMRQYSQYLEAKGSQNNIDIGARKKEVIDRLQAVAWAKAVGDRSALENELRGLLFMDNDKNSPLYQYSISQLKQLPAKKKSAL